MKSVNLKFRIGAKLATSAAVGVVLVGVMPVARKIESNRLKARGRKIPLDGARCVREQPQRAAGGSRADAPHLASARLIFLDLTAP